ncbi:MAG: hypothetical protein ACHBNF_07535, partial [Chromatiales bacterium]
MFTVLLPSAPATAIRECPPIPGSGQALLQRERYAFDLPFEELRLSGQLTELDEQGLLLYRLRPVSVWDRLSLWVQHLVLNSLQPAGIA